MHGFLHRLMVGRDQRGRGVEVRELEARRGPRRGAPQHAVGEGRHPLREEVVPPAALHLERREVASPPTCCFHIIGNLETMHD